MSECMLYPMFARFRSAGTLFAEDERNTPAASKNAECKLDPFLDKQNSKVLYIKPNVPQLSIDTHNHLNPSINSTAQTMPSQSAPQSAPQPDLSSLPLTLSTLQQRRQQLERCQKVIDEAEAELSRLELRLQIEINMRLLKLDVAKYEKHHMFGKEPSK